MHAVRGTKFWFISLTADSFMCKAITVGDNDGVGQELQIKTSEFEDHNWANCSTLMWAIASGQHSHSLCNSIRYIARLRQGYVAIVEFWGQWWILVLKILMHK